jgi:hypothetical protein
MKGSNINLDVYQYFSFKMPGIIWKYHFMIHNIQSFMIERRLNLIYRKSYNELKYVEYII